MWVDTIAWIYLPEDFGLIWYVTKLCIYSERITLFCLGHDDVMGHYRSFLRRSSQIWVASIR